MKSAIEEHGIASTVCHWWELAIVGEATAPNAINWLHGAGATHPDESVSDEFYFLSQTLYERKMLP